MSESGHPDADPTNPDQKYRYQASNPIVCFSCVAKEDAEEKWRKDERMKKLNPFAVTRRIDL